MVEHLNLAPIYGWGWSDRDGDGRDVPANFVVDAEQTSPTSWRGHVVSDGHEFAGALAHISQRHVTWDGCVNVALHSAGAGKLLAAGFAQVEPNKASLLP
jgi:hypothetical protein